MAHCSRRDFLKTGLAAGALAGTGSLPLKAARQTATDWVTLGKSGVKVTRLAFGTGSYQRASAARTGTGRVHEAGAPRLRPRHSLLRDRRVLRRDAQDARRGAEGHSARQLPADVEGDHARRRGSAGRRSTNCASSRTPITSTSCCCTGSTRRRGRPTPCAGRTAFWKRKSKKAVVGHGASVHGLPALRRFPETSGSISP